MKDDILLYPGFSQSKSLYGNYKYVNLWEEKYKESDLTGIKYLIGHSMGSLPCLSEWRNNQDAIIILFNPLIPKRNIISILFRFLKMLILQKGTMRAIKGSTNILYIPIAILNSIKFLKMDPISILKSIPKDKLIIIRGENDTCFFDNSSIETIKSLGIGYIELKSVGHYFDKKVDDLITGLIK